MDQCIYQKVSGSKICFFILYVDEASYVIGIKIHIDRHKGVLGLSQETYINNILERFQMKDCSPSVAPIVKGDKFNLNQCPKRRF